MFKTIIFCLMVLIMVLPVQSQTVSPLHQVMSSQSMIDRPIIFRDLQRDISDEWKETTPGLRLELLYNRMSEVRKNILDIIVTPKVKLTEMGLSIFIEKDTLSIEFKNKIPKNIWVNTEIKLSRFLSLKIKKTFLSARLKEHQNSILSSIIVTLEELGFQSNNQPDKAERLSLMLTKYLVQQVEKEISREHYILAGLKEPNTGIKKFNESVNKIIVTIASSLKSRLAEALDKAEDKIANLVDSYSKILVSANTGLAVTEGEGAFSGGLMLSFVKNSSVQFGLYVNGQLSESIEKKENTDDSTENQEMIAQSTMSDTTNLPRQSLIGFSGTLAFDRLQIDVLASTLFERSGPKDSRVIEAAVGVSYRSHRDFILGASYFWLGLPKMPDLHTAGLTFKATSPGSPSLLIGITFRKDQPTQPVFQISMPILAKR